jgi:putative salt-induced outer membrane protein YdiY
MTKVDGRVHWVRAAALSLLLVAQPAMATGGEVTVARGIALKGEGFKGQVTADLGVTTGNTELVQLKAGALSSYTAGPHDALASVSGAYAEQAGTEVGKQIFLHAHYRYRLLEHLAAEVYTNYAYDKFAGFDVQYAAGPDLVLLFEVDALRVDVGLGYMVQYEDYGAITGEAAGEHQTAHRAQVYVFADYALADNLSFVEHAFYLPRLNGPGPSDYTIISASSLSIKLGRVLSFQNSFKLAYDAPPPLNTKALNTELTVGLAVNF